MEELVDNTVIVIDLGNYKTSYAEPVPFKAVAYEKYEHELWVRSLVTGKNYEIYYHQIIEGLDIEQIKNLLDMSK